MEVGLKKRRNKIKYLPTYAFSLESGQMLEIRPTANAWWRYEYKVRLLLFAFQEGYRTPKACERIGISLRQYKYFASAHPEIRDVYKYYRSQLIEESKRTVLQKIKTNKSFALRFWRRAKAEEFPRPYLQERIKEITDELEFERQWSLEEARRLKIILGRYMELCHELEKNFTVGGWYLQKLQEAEEEVKKYNQQFQLMSKKIRRFHSDTKPSESDMVLD